MATREFENRLERDGMALLPQLLTVAQREAIIAHEADEGRPRPVDWWKGRAAADPFYAALARDERVLAALRSRLGENIILWGIDILVREPGQVHPWHCDIESCRPDGGFLSVWLGLANTSRESALNCIPGSHKFGTTLQAKAHAAGHERGTASDDMVLSWARDFTAAPELHSPDVQDGDAIVFDGRLWHGTRNTRAQGTRVSLLMQYARGDCPVYMISKEKLNWPFRFDETLRPPVVVVSGAADPSANRIVPWPVAA